VNRRLLLIGILLAAAGCSSDDPEAVATATLSNALLNGSWSTACLQTNPPLIATVTFNNGEGSGEFSYFSDGACADVAMIETSTFTYSIGADVTVDGSVEGIRTATRIDITETTEGSPYKGNIEYDIYAIKDLIELYVGDSEGLYDGTSASLRPTQLDSTVFIKQ